LIVGESRSIRSLAHDLPHHPHEMHPIPHPRPYVQARGIGSPHRPSSDPIHLGRVLVSRLGHRVAVQTGHHQLLCSTCNPCQNLL
jgi:hypothetical protein